MMSNCWPLFKCPTLLTGSNAALIVRACVHTLHSMHQPPSSRMEQSSVAVKVVESTLKPSVKKPGQGAATLLTLY